MKDMELENLEYRRNPSKLDTKQIESKKKREF